MQQGRVPEGRTNIAMNMEMEIQPPVPAALNPHLPLISCDRHPGEPVIGFCASCLRDRLAGLEATEAPRKSTSTAIKSIFFRSSVTAGRGPPSSNSFRRPELRRCKSFSSSRAAAASAAALVEPKRKSCDVRVRNTLSFLFHQDDRVRGCPNLGLLPAITVPEDEGREDTEEIVPAADEEMVEEKEEPLAEMKPMKDHIDLDSHAKKLPPKDLKDIAGSFWLAASVFSKKVGIWRRKQKLKKKPENGLDAVGRRSCDIDPRFSLDAGRFSFDDPRLSWDEPRASWDGFLFGSGRPAPPRLPPILLSVVEDSPAAAVQRFDGEIPVEEDLVFPGGTLHTRDNYDGRRRSLDQLNSTRRQSFETSELLTSYHGSKHERDSRELYSESFDSGLRDQQPKVPPLKKSRRWSKAWNIWGLIHRRSGDRNRDIGVERSFSETWPELQANGRLFRSNSSVSSRSSASGNGGFGSMRRNGLESNGQWKKKKDVVALERNRSARYSPRQFDNGLLRFYLPPLKGSRRGRAWGRSKYSSPHSFTGSMLSLY